MRKQTWQNKAEQPLSSVKSRRVRTKQATPDKEKALICLPAFADLINYHGGWKSFGECHKDLADFVTKPQTDIEGIRAWRKDRDEKRLALRRLVLMPRGHLKTSVATVLYVLWRIYRNPNIRILVGSNIQTLSHSFIRELRSYLENEELRKNVWDARPHIQGTLIPNINARSRTRTFGEDTDALDRKIVWNNTSLQVNRSLVFKEPTVYAGSVGSPVTGQHYDLAILDDLHDQKNVDSEVKRKGVFDWIEDVESVINPADWFEVPGLPDNGEILGGEQMFTGTRYGVDDYYGVILADNEEENTMEYAVLNRNIYKNGENSEGGYLWHEKYNDKLIARLRSRMSARRFSSQYLNKVYEKDFGVFNWELIECVSDESVYTSEGFVWYRDSAGMTQQLNPIIAVDPAFSSSKKGDDCCVLLGSKLNDGRLLVFDGFLDRVEATTLTRDVQKLADKYLCYRLYYEENGVGMLLPELFKSRTPKGRQIITYGHYEQRNKEAKIQGVLELPLNTGNFLFCKRLHTKEKFKNQIKRFPSVKNDDLLDGLVTLYEKTNPIRQRRQEIKPSINYSLVSPILNKDNRAEHETQGIREYIPYA